MGKPHEHKYEEISFGCVAFMEIPMKYWRINGTNGPHNTRALSRSPLSFSACYINSAKKLLGEFLSWFLPPEAFLWLIYAIFLRPWSNCPLDKIDSGPHGTHVICYCTGPDIRMFVQHWHYHLVNIRMLPRALRGFFLTN